MTSNFMPQRTQSSLVVSGANSQKAGLGRLDRRRLATVLAFSCQEP